MVFGVSHDSVTATCGQKQPLLLPEHIPITLLTLLYSFFLHGDKKFLGGSLIFEGARLLSHPQGVAVAQSIVTHCLLLKVKVSTLLSGCHVWECQIEARADSKVVKLTAPSRLPVWLLGSHWLLLLTATCSSTHRRLRGLSCHVVFAPIVNNCFHLKAKSNQKIMFVP